MFAQESVMDIQKIKELALANGFSLKEQASGNMDLHSYVYEFANAIEQAVKTQAVPEGFLLMPRKCTNKMAHAAKAVDGRLSAFKYADVYDAMIEAQEQTHD